jgi:hypothetical protein
MYLWERHGNIGSETSHLDNRNVRAGRGMDAGKIARTAICSTNVMILIAWLEMAVETDPLEPQSMDILTFNCSARWIVGLGFEASVSSSLMN